MEKTGHFKPVFDKSEVTKYLYNFSRFGAARDQ